MRWRVAERKLRFLCKLLDKDWNNIAKNAVLNKVLLGFNGLAYECKISSEKTGLPNVMYNNVTKVNIKLAIEKVDFQKVKEEMQNSTKCRDRLMDNPLDNSYLSYIPLPFCRIWMRYRGRSIAVLMANMKSTYRRRGRNLDCRFCDSLT